MKIIIIGDENYEKACRILAAADIVYVPVDKKQDRFYDSLQRSKCEEAAFLLSVAFSWEDSPEGGKYWEEVHQKLFRYGIGEE